MNANTALIIDVDFVKRLVADRQSLGIDRYDEVWEGMYVMAPMPNYEHQRLVSRLTTYLSIALGLDSEWEVIAGANISDREEDWQHNYRVPDVFAVAPGRERIDRGAFVLGGPDFVIEIASPYDRTRDKLSFYAHIGVREVLIIDRQPWQMELLQLTRGDLSSVGVTSLDTPVLLASAVLGISFQFIPGTERPGIILTRLSDDTQWIV